MNRWTRTAICAAALAMLTATGAGSAPGGWHSYTNAELGYSISYPAHWALDTHYSYDQLNPDHPIKGVSFTIPAGMARGTNLSTETRLSVESLPGRNCQPSQFVDPAENVRKVHADGRVYTTATSEDAGAGNLYETQLFVIEGGSPCLAVRYFIHSTNIGNYDPGTVRAFDRRALDRAFDSIRATLRLKRRP